MNRGAGYGMEVPCIYRLYGRRRYIDRAKEAMLKLLNDCLLHYAVTNCITVKYLISFAIRNSEVSAIESSKCIGIYGDAFRSA